MKSFIVAILAIVAVFALLKLMISDQVARNAAYIRQILFGIKKGNTISVDVFNI